VTSTRAVAIFAAAHVRSQEAAIALPADIGHAASGRGLRCATARCNPTWDAAQCAAALHGGAPAGIGPRSAGV
jgi:hypothetical protein